MANPEGEVEFCQQNLKVKDAQEGETPKFSKNRSTGAEEVEINKHQAENQEENQDCGGEPEQQESLDNKEEETVQQKDHHDVQNEKQDDQEKGHDDRKEDDTEMKEVDSLGEGEEEKEEEINPKHVELLDQAEQLKKEGNEFFKAKDFPKARSKYARVFCYTRGLSSALGEEGIAQMVQKGQGKIHQSITVRACQLERDANSNLAMAYMQEENWSKVVEKCNLSIKIEPTVKAYFRRGKAYAMKNDYSNAYKDFNTGQKEFPGDKELFKKEVVKTKQREKQYDKAEAQRLSKAMTSN